MTNLIRRLKAAWVFSANWPHTQLPNDYWTPDDAHVLSRFLTGDTGRKLRFILLEKVNSTAQRAIMERNNSRYECGVAFGTRATLAEIDSLLIVPLAPGESEQPTEENAAGFVSVNR